MPFLPQSSNFVIPSSNATSLTSIPWTKPTPSAFSSVAVPTSSGEFNNEYVNEDQIVMNEVNAPWWASKYWKRQKEEERDITYTTVTITLTESPTPEQTSTSTVFETITTVPGVSTSTITQTFIPPGEVTTIWVTQTIGTRNGARSTRLSTVLLALVMTSVFAWL